MKYRALKESVHLERVNCNNNNRVFIRRFYRDLHVVQNILNNLKKSGYVITDMIEMTYQQPQMRDVFIDEMQIDISLQMRKDCFIEFLTLPNLRAVQVL